ncbi:MAG: DUF1292 domain-containing protein [Firmicutes bacterium]|nr:DUF1292 domain-containing protein [Bacillota bacterium]
MEEMHDELITLVDEEGQEHEFMVLDVIMVNEQKYAILIPALTESELEDEVDEEETEAVIFRINEDEENLVLVEDEEEFAAVAEAWEELAMEYEEDIEE